ncbi:MAG: DUF559 domain-containing protein [Salaquimonas sp.]
MPHFNTSPFVRLNAKRMRHEMTDAELNFWNVVRAHRFMGLGFRRQYPIGKFIVDFACPKHKLIIELDGLQHAEIESRINDSKRTRALENDGWLVLRFWNDQVMTNIDDVCDHIIAVLSENGVSLE